MAEDAEASLKIPTHVLDSRMVSPAEDGPNYVVRGEGGESVSLGNPTANLLQILVMATALRDPNIEFELSFDSLLAAVVVQGGEAISAVVEMDKARSYAQGMLTRRGIAWDKLVAWGQEIKAGDSFSATRSAIRVMRDAVRMRDAVSLGRLGAKHVVAALIYGDHGHEGELISHGFEPSRMSVSFIDHVQMEFGVGADVFKRMHVQRYPDHPIGMPNQVGSKPLISPQPPDGDLAVDSFARDSTRYVATFGADDPGAQSTDLLDIEEEARAFARIAASRQTRLPLSIGIFGEWGSGKTFFMGHIARQVSVLADRAGDYQDDDQDAHFLPDIIQIHFNAWHYIETNLWASLVDYIFSELDRALRKKEAAPGKVEQLFSQLSTSRVLKLESVQDLIQRRRDRKAAQQELEDTKLQYEAALLSRSATRPSDFWTAVWKTFESRLDNTDEKKLDAIVERLALKELDKSMQSLHEIIRETDTEAGRAMAVRTAMARQFGSVGWILAAVVALVTVPVAVVLARDLLSAIPALSWIGRVNEAVLAAAAGFASAAGWLGAFVRSARSTIGELDSFRQRVDDAVKERTDEFKAKSAEQSDLAAAEREMARLQSEVTRAEANFAEADKRAQDALRDFEGATSRGRLAAFIREKLSSGDYAKHLGLIATIRKDFEQLAQLMSEVAGDSRSREKYKQSHDEYRQRLDRMLDEAKDLLDVAEVTKFREPEFKLSQERLFSRVILYIDDLDRCPTEKVVEVLQAVHLLLYFPLFVVVVAVDARWVAKSLRQEFPQLIGEEADPASEAGSSELRSASSLDYLEKIFQIPYWVRPMERSAVQRFVSGVVGRDPPQYSVTRAPSVPGALDVSGRPDPPEIFSAEGMQDTAPSSGSRSHPAALLSPLASGLTVPRTMTLAPEEQDFLADLAPLVGGTPRRVLRFINVYRLVKTSLGPDLYAALYGSGSPTGYRSVAAQVAIVTGAPHFAAEYFDMLARAADRHSMSGESPKPGWVSQLGYDIGEGTPEHLRIREVLYTLAARINEVGDLTRRTELDELAIIELNRVAPIARRYSFSIGAREASRSTA